jgi:hypothetical protein
MPLKKNQAKKEEVKEAAPQQNLSQKQKKILNISLSEDAQMTEAVPEIRNTRSKSGSRAQAQTQIQQQPIQQLQNKNSKAQHSANKKHPQQDDESQQQGQPPQHSIRKDDKSQRRVKTPLRSDNDDNLNVESVQEAVPKLKSQ